MICAGILTITDNDCPPLVEDIPVFETQLWMHSHLICCQECGSLWAALRLFTLQDDSSMRRLEFVPTVHSLCRDCGDGSLLQHYPILSGRIPVGDAVLKREIELEIAKHVHT